MGIRLAIVGSTVYERDRAAAAKARTVIAKALEHYNPEAVLSGGASGIDSIAAEMARGAGYPVVEHLPKNARWEPDGYKARNLLIAEDCTHLLAIRHPASKTYGSGWTADRAEEMGRVVHRRIVG